MLQLLPFEFLTLEALGITEDVEETGTSYEANAILKAEFFGKKSGLPTLADDSGIHVDALHHELGVHTRRWGAGKSASDQEWLDYFLARMASEKIRSAEFISVLALHLPFPLDKTKTFRGICRGELLSAPAVALEPGLPLSALFVPDGEKKVFSALSREEKSRLSHRGRALQACAAYLTTCVEKKSGSP